MTLQSKWKVTCIARLVLASMLLIVASASAAAQTNTFPTTGNAGAGTTSPDRKLEVMDSGSPQMRLTHTAGSVYTDFQTLSSGNLIISPTGPDTTSTKPFSVAAGSDAFRFYPNADTNLRWSLSTDASGFFHIVQKGDGWANQGTRFSINRSGNVGIGTTSPGQKLNVIGNGLFGDLTSRTLLYSGYDSQLNPFLELGYGTSHSAITPFPAFVLSNNTTSTSNAEGIIGQIAFANRSIADNNDKRTAIITSWVDGASNSGTLQFYTSNAGTLAERFRVTSSGNVGIGTGAPNYKLDVNGEINATGIRINGTPISSGGSSQWSGTSGNPIYYNTGNVGIGTTTPANKFEVVEANSATASSIRVLTGSASAYGGYAIGRTATEGYWGVAGGAGHYSTGAVPGDVVLRAESNLILGNSENSTVYLKSNGNVGISNTSPTEKLHVTGNGKFTGNLTVDGNINAKYQDLAEWVPSSEQLAAGTVVVLDTTKSNQVISSGTAYDTRVAGVISAQPGITLGEGGEGKVLVATTGRVRVKVDASRGPIQIGDLLVTSDVAGLAMKSEAVNLGGVQIHRPGTIIGKALEPLAKGSGEILVLLSLQ